MIRKAIIRYSNVPINVLQYTGDNYGECCDFVGKELEYISKEEFSDIPEDVLIFKGKDGGLYCYPNYYIIEFPKDYLIKVHGDSIIYEDKFFPFYPCRKELFDLFYEFTT